MWCLETKSQEHQWDASVFRVTLDAGVKTCKTLSMYKLFKRYKDLCSKLECT